MLATNCLPHSISNDAWLRSRCVAAGRAGGGLGTTRLDRRSVAETARDGDRRSGSLYIVDMTGRIQVFSPDGQFLRSWRTPEITDGRPRAFVRPLRASDGRRHPLLPSSVLLDYGELHEELAIGGVYGQGPGEFHFVTDCVQDSQGNYYVAEYGEFDRIQKFSPQREFLFQWGNQGRAGPAVHASAESGDRRAGSVVGCRFLQPSHPGV
jgi:hypothetical protein